MPGLTTEQNESVDLEALEEAAYAETEGYELENEHEEGADDSAPTTEDDDALLGAEAEEEFDDTDDGTLDETDEEADDQEDDNDDVEAEEGEEVEDEEYDDEADREDPDAITVANAQKRISNAQARMHETIRERDSLKNKLDSVSKELSELKAAVDKGEAIPTSERKRQALMGKLEENEDARDMLESNPEILDIFMALTSGDEDTSSKGEESAQGKQQENPGQTPEEKQWYDVVLKEIPDFLEIQQTEDYQKVMSQHPKVMAAVSRRYTNLDPEGAKYLYNFYKTQKAKASSKPTKNVSTSKRIKSSTRPTSKGKSVQRNMRKMAIDYERTLE